MSETPQALPRPHVKAMDALLGVPAKVLDHGFIRVIDYMGDESAIVQAARVSYGAGTKTPSDDAGLIRYLLRNWHTTPFEMCEIKVHVKLPVFVARQWIRHRTANVNEYSARYSILAREFSVPAVEDIQPQSKSNKQGRAGAFADDRVAALLRSEIERASNAAFDSYDELLTGWPWVDEAGNYIGPATVKAPQQHEEEHGMARELARSVLPMNTYTEWYWKVDAHNLMHFLRLRADPHAQAEIREYANALCMILLAWMPTVYKAFVDYRMEAKSFSRAEMEALRDLIDRAGVGEPALTRHGSLAGLSGRELAEFKAKLLAGS